MAKAKNKQRKRTGVGRAGYLGAALVRAAGAGVRGLRGVGAFALSHGLSPAIVAVVVVGAALVREPMLARASALHDASDGPVVVRLDLGEDVPDGLGRVLRACVLRSVGSDPYDGSGLSEARSALLVTGWVYPDVLVRRESAGVVVVEGTVRRPACVVRTRDGDHVVTREGVRTITTRAIGESMLPAVVGVTTEAPAPGEVWPGGEIRPALNLLSALSGEVFYEQIGAVDVSGFARDRTLVIETDRGTRVWWGGPVDTFNPGEPDTGVKLGWLRGIYDEFGHIDGWHKTVRLDIDGNAYVLDGALDTIP